MTPAQIKKEAEKAFEDQGNFYGHPSYIHRLVDNCDLMNRGNRGHASLPRQPSDFIVTIKRQMFYAEIKGTELDSFSLSRFEPSQWAGMMRTQAAGGKYFVFIWHVPSKSWVIIDAARILDMREQNIKSINLTKESKINVWTTKFI